MFVHAIKKLSFKGLIGSAFSLVFLLSGCSPREDDAESSQLPIDFNWDIRPILSDKCFQCHGPDAEALKAGLRLDIRELALEELSESPGRYAIIPGDIQNSELVSRITAQNSDERMPPESSHKHLSEQEITLLQQWIEEGAEYKEHWAFIPPKLTEVPDTIFDVQGENGIDEYIFTRLQQEGLTPSSVANKEALINRATLTLTGLPPTLEAVDDFIADESPEAYLSLVDNLLSSPSYGEHMSAYWMDLARWSDTDGFLDDHHDRFLWPWRDWVIRSFNNNMPYDQFATWQLAGDLLPDPTQEQILATTFVRLGLRSTENGAIEEEYSAEYRAERTDNLVGTTFLGLTVACARCHDHRYDPIPQSDYYSISAFFNNTDEPGVYPPGFSGVQAGPTLAWPDDNTRLEIDRLEEEVSRLEDVYLRARSALRQQAETEVEEMLENEGELARLLEWSVSDELAAYYPFDEVQKAELSDLPDSRPLRVPPDSINGLMAGPYAPPQADTDNETADQRRMREFRELQGRVPRNYNGDELYLSQSVSAESPASVLQQPLLREGVNGQALFFNETNKGFLGENIGWYERTEPFSFDFWFFLGDDYDDAPIINHVSEQNSGKTGYQLSIKEGHLWVTLAHSPPANMIALLSNEALPVGEWSHLTLTYDGSSVASGTKIYIDGRPLGVTVEHDSLTRSMLPWGTGDVFDPFVGLAFGTRFRVKAPVGSGLDEMRVYDKELNPVEVTYLHDASLLEGVNVEELRLDLVDLVIDNKQEVKEAHRVLIEARSRLNEQVTAVPQVLVMGTSPGHESTYVLNRGVYSEPTEEVFPKGLDAVLAWDETLPANRLGLAQWLFDEENPLTARVFVNRIWQMHFGHGLVETSEDFGSQGAIPTHPELLDWLTIQFTESGWDIKFLHRLIVTSATYRQDSNLSEALSEKDPGNQLYARGPRWRMTAEMIRDQALFLSGQLSNQIGGASATPYQPDAIWNPLNSFYAYPDPEDVSEEEHHRRSLYTFIKRNAPHPALGIFDFKNRTTSISRRRTSNTPLQALVLMNDPQYLEAYQLLAERVLQVEDDEEARVSLLYRMVTRTFPDEAMLAILTQYYTSQHAYFSENNEMAVDLLAAGVTALDPSINTVELAALSNVVSVIMNAPDAYTVK